MSAIARTKGFSLLELLVAIFILAMSLSMLYKVAAGVLQTSSKLQMQQTAALVAQSLLNSRDTVPPSGWNESGTDAGIQWRVSSAPLLHSNRAASTDPLRLHQVRLILQWQGRSERMDWSIDTVRPEAEALSSDAPPR